MSSAPVTAKYCCNVIPVDLCNRPSMKICRTLLICETTFYAVYYIVSGVCYAVYSLDKFDGLMPFNFESWIYLPNCCTFSNKEMAQFTSMQLTFCLFGVLFGMFIKEWVWDYPVTVTLFHILLSCIVMHSFPHTWSWWFCLGFAMLLMILFGGVASLFPNCKRNGKVIPHGTGA